MNFNFPFLYIKETESTNIVALDLLSKTNPLPGFLVITDYQTAGKGQYGRNWLSEPGKNILFSLIFMPLNLSVNDIFRLHLASSIALIRTLKKWNLSQLTIKWPNDIYVGSQKLAGILIQNQLKGYMVESSVIGIGININQAYFPAALNATSIILETGIEIIREELVIEIRSQLLDMMSMNEDFEWDSLWREYNSNLYLKDHLVAITTKDGKNLSGNIHSVTKSGNLRIQNAGQQFTDFSFGEIKYHKFI